jgi:hypothetical protein
MADPIKALTPAYFEWLFRRNSLEAIEVTIERLRLVRRGLAESAGLSLEEMPAEDTIFHYVGFALEWLEEQQRHLANCASSLDDTCGLDQSMRSFEPLLNYTLSRGISEPADVAIDRVLN